MKDKFSFNKNILDQEELKKRVITEARKIFNSPRARVSRSLEQIRKVVYQGQHAELFLIQEHNCIENSELYGDVIFPNGVKIECKTSVQNWTESSKNFLVNKIKVYNPSEIIMFWFVSGDEYIYQGFKKIQ